jgi:predicted RecA/RadA family phage recombinase
MATNYVQEGNTIQYTAGADISSGDVVVIGSNGDAIIGVALVDIANGSTGSVAIEGVFTVAKVSAAVIAQGEYVVWDASASEFDDNAATPATGDVSDGAIAWEAAGNGVTSIAIKLTGRPGTLTA